MRKNTIKLLPLLVFFFFATTLRVYAQCNPIVTNPGATGDFIQNFTFGSLTNLMSGDNPTDYQLYASTNNFVKGSSYPLSIQTGSALLTESIGMWIDYNGNNTFEFTEFVYSSPGLVTSSSILTGTITIPNSALPGIRRLRVCAKYNFPINPLEACTIPTFGEYEDYSITILSNIACSAMPIAGTTISSSTNVCPGIAITNSLIGTSLQTGIAYQWLQANNCTGSWSIIAGATNPSYVVIPSAGNTIGYRCKLTCNSTGLSDTSIASCVNVQAWSCNSPCYGISSAINDIDQDIFNVTMGTLNNTTDCLNPLQGSQGSAVGIANRFANFSGSVPSPTLYHGLNQTFSIKIGTCGTSISTAVKVFIDYNHNASFSDPGETIYANTNIPSVLPAATINGSFTVPITAISGCTKMRIVTMSNWIGPITAIGSYAYGETEEYDVNIVQPSPYDPSITSISVPTGNCFSVAESLTATIHNAGSNLISLVSHPVNVELHVRGPLGVSVYTQTLTSGTLLPYGANTITTTFTGIDLYNGGDYSVNTTLSIAGLSNGNIQNDSLQVAVSRTNYRPNPSADFHVCQGSLIPFGQGLTVSGCATPIADSALLTFTKFSATSIPCLPSSIFYTGACLVGFTNWPTLPPGTTLTGGILQVTNLSTANGGWANEARFPLFSGTMPVSSSNILFPSAQGNPASSVSSFTWQNAISGTQLSNMYAPGSALNIGYYSTWLGNATNNGVTFDAFNIPTSITLKIYFTWVPASFEWYTSPIGGTVLNNYIPFNPLTTSGSGITHTNTPSSVSFFAACSGSSDCRTEVKLIIDSIPSVSQTTIEACEYAIGSNNGIFNLTSVDGMVSNLNPFTTVSYFGDEALFIPITNPTQDTNSSSIVYSKVSYANGCSSSDSVILQVHPIPQFSLPVYTGIGCAPIAMDISTLLTVYPTSGNDTLFFQDPSYSTPFVNPHAILFADTVYMIVQTSNATQCADSAMSILQILPSTNFIANQDTTLLFSNCGPVGCSALTLGDGQSETFTTNTDCRKIATVTDMPNGISMGATQVCEDIACGVPTYNGQPYLNRHYEMTPTHNDSAIVCIYFLQQDFNEFNDYATANGLQTLTPSLNICVTQVDGGLLGAIGSTAISIPHSVINASYDSASTVWTICFPVDSFSSFYCHACNPMNMPLPVELVDFSGKKEGHSVALQWTTSTEMNNDYFMVERSYDGIHFEKISVAIPTKALHGNSLIPLSYHFTDLHPKEGNNYYRLLQNDINGVTAYSSTVNMVFANTAAWQVYPNPAEKNLHIDFQSFDKGQTWIKIVDVTGRIIKVIDTNKDLVHSTIDIDISDLTNGTYWIQCVDKIGAIYSTIFQKR